MSHAPRREQQVTETKTWLVGCSPRERLPGSAVWA
jgi:hypothetical protein